MVTKVCLICGSLREIKHLSKKTIDDVFQNYYCNDNQKCKNKSK